MIWHLHEGVSFEPPRDWLESTMVRFNPPPSPPGSPPVPSITMSRQPLAAGHTLRVHADRLLTILAREVPVLELLSSEEATVGERPAVMLRFVFKLDAQAEGTIDQTMAVVGAGSEREPMVIVFSLACPPAVAEANRAVFAKVLQTVRFDDSGTASAAPSAVVGPPGRPASSTLGELPLGPMPGSRSR